jgi:hypothetical protein
LDTRDVNLIVRQMNAGLREVIDLEDRSTLERWLLLPEERRQQILPGQILGVKAQQAYVSIRHPRQSDFAALHWRSCLRQGTGLTE